MSSCRGIESQGRDGLTTQWDSNGRRVFASQGGRRFIQSNPLYIAQFKQTQSSQSAVQKD